MRSAMRHAVGLALLWPALLQAQPVKPRVIFDVDTSGSMAWEACDPSIAGDVDHTTDCPGVDVPCATCGATGCDNGLPDDGRLWKVKTAIADVVAAYGEVEFALARFHSTPNAFSCPAGGWVGPNVACFGAPLGQGDNAADILVEFHDDNQRDILDWLDLQSNTAGPPSDTGCNLCDDCGGGCDKELRPTGATPLAGSIFSCNEYLDSVRSMDAPSPCRPYAMIVLSDGQNNCDDPANPTDNDPTPEQAAAACANGIPVHVIGFAAPSIKPLLDRIADEGCDPPCEDPDMDGVPNCSNEAILVDDEVELGLACSDIIQSMVLTMAEMMAEKCNGQDDDCDGLTDEDYAVLGTPCGVGSCQGSVCCDASDPDQANTTCCGPAPGCECCNGQDDDCDGIRDNNIDWDCDGSVDFPPVVCSCFPEECNGYDDDCDCGGCGSGGEGDTNGDGVVCGPGDVGVDEEPLVTSGYPCGSDVGECVAGLTCCSNSTPACCGEVGATPELCDCLDNDCNGATDEGGFTDCFRLGDGCDPSTGVCKGVCQLGQSGCRDIEPGPGCTAGFGACLGQRGPDTETCNCVDDNCDGFTDEDVICPAGGRCENCGCPHSCGHEFPCPGGFNCECSPDVTCDCGVESVGDPNCTDNWFCQVDACLGIVCPACEFCDPATGGTCVPLCGSGAITCHDWEECRCDACVDISCTNPDETPCADGERCNPVTHMCEPDPCSEVACGDDEYCRADGKCGGALCVPVCPVCLDDETCVCGECVPDPCANVACTASQACCNGNCIADPCLAIDCGPGQRCSPCAGSCENDPCAPGQIECPGESVCRHGECVPRHIDFSVGGSGGCGCHVAVSPSTALPSAAILGSALVLSLRRRRRSRKRSSWRTALGLSARR